ncbi:colicin immunity domain-containing protein [Streptomyces sp. NPDC096152]|uniref:colicin immunity domain-containing protein n=1 Tax=Streptomyces sp. NPDC096152 TaxID=3366078 RepID=UPI00380CD8AA
MRELSDGAVGGATFARRWLAGRRHAMGAGERPSDAITAALDEVFYGLEDYALDPTLQDEEDLTDEELRRHVTDAVQRIRDLR